MMPMSDISHQVVDVLESMTIQNAPNHDESEYRDLVSDHEVPVASGEGVGGRHHRADRSSESTMTGPGSPGALIEFGVIRSPSFGIRSSFIPTFGRGGVLDYTPSGDLRVGRAGL